MRIGKYDLSDNIKQDIFQDVVVSVLLYSYITWTLTKNMEKKPVGSMLECCKILEAAPFKQRLYDHFPPI